MQQAHHVYCCVHMVHTSHLGRWGFGFGLSGRSTHKKKHNRHTAGPSCVLLCTQSTHLTSMIGRWRFGFGFSGRSKHKKTQSSVSLVTVRPNVDQSALRTNETVNKMPLNKKKTSLYPLVVTLFLCAVASGNRQASRTRPAPCARGRV